MEGCRCGVRGGTWKERPRAKTRAWGQPCCVWPRGPEPRSAGAPRSASAPRVALRPAPLPAPAPSSAEGAAVPRGRAQRNGGRGPCPARRGAARARPRSAAVHLPGRRQRRGGARWRPGWGRGCWPWPWGRQVRGGHGGRRGRGWARLVLLPRGRAEAWSSPSVPGSGWELCVGGGGCVGTRMLRERPWLSREDLGVLGQCPWPGAWAGERRFTALNLWYVGVGVAGKCPSAMVVEFLAPVAVLLQECVHS